MPQSRSGRRSALPCSAVLTWATAIYCPRRPLGGVLFLSGIHRIAEAGGLPNGVGFSAQHIASKNYFGDDRRKFKAGVGGLSKAGLKALIGAWSGFGGGRLRARHQRQF